MPLIHSSRQGKYDQQAAYDAYMKYCDTDDREALLEAFDRVIPLIYTILKGEFKFSYLEKEDLFEEAAKDIWRRLQDKYYKGDPGNLTVVVLLIARSAMNNFARRFGYPVQIFDYNGLKPSYATFDSPALAIYRVFLEELPGLVRDSVLDRIRFGGHMYETCMYVLDQYLNERDISHYVTKKKFNASGDDTLLAIDYVKVLIRDSLYNLRSLIGTGIKEMTYEEIFDKYDPDV